MRMEFKSKTLFYAPIWIDDYNKFVQMLNSDKRYRKCLKKGNTNENITCRKLEYMLPYITNIYI